MAISEAKKINDAKWRKKLYEQLTLQIRKDAEINSDVIRRYAASKGMSVSAFVRNVLEQMIRDDADFVI